MAKLRIHPFGIAIIVLGFVGWLVGLIGMAINTSYCNKQGDTGIQSIQDGNNQTVAYSLTVSCAQEYQMEWWSIWFEFFLLIIILGTSFSNAFDRARFIYLTYLALVTVLLTQTATSFCSNSFKLNGGKLNLKDTKQSALNTAAAGAVIMCITNYALIIFIGLGAAAAQMGGLHLSGPEAKYQPSNF